MDLCLLAEALNIGLRIFRPQEADNSNFEETHPKEYPNKNCCISIAYHSSSSYAVLS